MSIWFFLLISWAILSTSMWIILACRMSTVDQMFRTAYHERDEAWARLYQRTTEMHRFIEKLRGRDVAFIAVYGVALHEELKAMPKRLNPMNIAEHCVTDLRSFYVVARMLKAQGQKQMVLPYAMNEKIWDELGHNVVHNDHPVMSMFLRGFWAVRYSKVGYNLDFLK